MEENKWGDRKGRVILKNPNVVRYEHDYFGEEIRYVCYCGMRLCSAEYVNDVTWYRHRKRAKANAEKSGKVFTCPERNACAVYKYHRLSNEELKDVLVRIEKMRERFDIPAQPAPAISDPGEGCDYDPGYDYDSMDYEDECQCVEAAYHRLMHTTDDAVPVVDYGTVVQSERLQPEVVERLSKEENSALRELLLDMMEHWRRMKAPKNAINGNLDILHRYNDILPDSKEWRSVFKRLNPGYTKLFACKHHHTTSDTMGSRCTYEGPEKKCNKVMDKCIRSTSVLDALCSKMHQRKFREGLQHGPNLDYKGERDRGVCSSIWSADYVYKMRHMHPDFFDLEKHTPLLFGIFVDGFRTSGSSNTAGCVTLVCFNLPGDIRMDMDQLHMIQLIDGPKEPDMEGWQRYLGLIVSEFQTLWNGFTLDGKRYRAALICTIQDGRAMSKTSMMAEAGHEFGCSKCTIRRTPLKHCPSKHSYSSKGNLEIGDDGRKLHDGTQFNDVWLPKSHEFVMERTSNRSLLQNKTLANGVKGKSVFCQLPNWDAGECHLVCFMHTVKNFGTGLQKLVQGENDTLKTRKELIEKKFITGDAFRPTEKILKDGTKKVVLPPTKPPWVLKQSSQDGRDAATASNLLGTVRSSSNLCFQPKRLLRKMQHDCGSLEDTDKGHQSDIGDKDTGESVPMKQFLFTGLFSCAMYYAGVDEELAQALDKLIVLMGKLTAPEIDMASLDDLERDIWRALCRLEDRVPITDRPLCYHSMGHFAHQVKMFGPLTETWAYPLESYLGHLKALALNKARPTASIYNRHIYNTVTSYLTTCLSQDRQPVSEDKYVDDLQLQGAFQTSILDEKDEEGIKKYIEVNWQAYKELQNELGGNPWKVGCNMAHADRLKYRHKKFMILNGMEKQADFYGRFTINRSTFSIKGDKKRDDRIVFFNQGRSVGILKKIVKVKVRAMSLPEIAQFFPSNQTLIYLTQFQDKEEVFLMVKRMRNVQRHSKLSIRTGSTPRGSRGVWLQERDISGQGFLATDPVIPESCEERSLIFSSGHLRKNKSRRLQ